MSKKNQISNPASALGEAIGKLAEEQVKEIILNYFIKKYPQFRLCSGKLSNGSGVSYDVDIIIKKGNDPVALIEVKFLRYKKHMRDKGSWIADALPNLRRTYPTVTYTLAILLGDWTWGSKDMLQKAGVDIIEIPFKKIVEIFRAYGIEVVWAEKDQETPKRAWTTFQKLSEDEKKEIGRKLIEGYEEEIIKRLEDHLLKAIEEEKLEKIILIIRTSAGRELLFQCKTTSGCAGLLDELRKIESGELKVKDFVERLLRRQQRSLADYF